VERQWLCGGRESPWEGGSLLLQATGFHDGGLVWLPGKRQAISTRTAGFQCIDVSLWAPSMQVFSCFMMYLAVYPQVRQLSDD
jgi:Trk-type K+ transport system membrane component